MWIASEPTQLTFEILAPGLSATAEASSLRGIALLDLSDGKTRSIPWKVTRKSPLVLMFDPKSASIRGVRRAGAHGAVTLHLSPEGSGTLIPNQFDSGVPIVAKLEPGTIKPGSIEARYQGADTTIQVVVPIP